MRTLLIAGLGAALASSAADAQRVMRRGPGAGFDAPGMATAAPRGQAQRWPTRGGHWIAALDAPGGYGAYRRPYVGYALPRYWAQPGFAIGDWSSYGLAQPRPGYRWSRYYDDAVLIDRYGSVQDHVDGIAWNAYGEGYADAYAAADDVPVAPDFDERGLADDGPGDAPSPSPRLARSHLPPIRGDQGGRWVSPDGRTTVVTGGYGHGGTMTTVVVQSAPVVTTTTTTEYHDDLVTYSQPVRRVHRRTYRPTKTIRR